MQMSSSEHVPVIVEEYSRFVQKAIKKDASEVDTTVKLEQAVRMVTYILAAKAVLGDLLTRNELEQLFPEMRKFAKGTISLVRLQ